MTRTIKTILVSLNNKKFLSSNMAMATQIAREYESHIIGLYVIPSALVYVSPYGYGGPINFSHQNKHYKSMASEREQSFRDIIAKENLEGEWRQINSLGHFISDTIIEHGREADLVILGDDQAIEADAEFGGRIAQDVGRPVLFVPDTKRKEIKLDKAIIGWDGSREAARAAFDAIPLLKMAKKTEVTCFNAHKENQISGDTPGSELANSLARYDINAEAVDEKTRKSVSQALMDRAKSSDLLVMGAYGHSRLMEDIFGGTTRKALFEMPCPILMSN